MKWHDYKTDKPKKEAQYLVYVQDYDRGFGGHFGVCFYFDGVYGSYFVRCGGERSGSKLKKQPLKWAEISLDEGYYNIAKERIESAQLSVDNREN